MDPFSSMDDIDLESVLSPPRVNHRRVRSDPTDFMRSVRADQNTEGWASGAKRDLSPVGSPTGVSPCLKKQASDQIIVSRPPSSLSDSATEADPMEPAPKPKKRSIFSRLPFPQPSTSMFTPEELAQPKQPNYSKKDVPMWTVEEDLLILQLVEQHGKKWSKIASNLPGRTDNGVRNRWNRMERAQVLRKNRGPAAGYRCRRCGEPKRGHICAARTIGEEVPEGDELAIKAAALTELSAQAMVTIPASLTEDAPPPPSSSSTAAAAAADGEMASRLPSTVSSSASTSTSASVPPATGAPGLPLYDTAVGLLTNPSSLGLPHPIVPHSPGSSNTAPSDYMRLSSTEVDDFLDELRRCLDDNATPPPAAEPSALPPPPPQPSYDGKFDGTNAYGLVAGPTSACSPISQRSLQTALATLAADASWPAAEPPLAHSSSLQLAF